MTPDRWCIMIFIAPTGGLLVKMLTARHTLIWRLRRFWIIEDVKD